MNLQKDYFLGQLVSLKATEEHLKSLAIYTRTFSHDSRVILDGLEYVHSNSSIHHRLILYYLINEILINEKSNVSGLKIGMTKFITENFQNDKETAINQEVIYKKFVELERIWKTKKMIDLDEKVSLDEIIYKIKECFTDKKALVEYLKSIVKFYENEKLEQ